MSPLARSLMGRFAAPVAVVSGSGLAVVPHGYTAADEVSYAELGWPESATAGHPNRLILARRGAAPAGGPPAERVLLAWGRAHRYEGWNTGRLQAAVRGLAELGVWRMVVTNAAGALRPGVGVGDVVVVEHDVDLQEAPAERPPVLPAMAPALAQRAVATLASSMRVRRGDYVAVAGPQYETPAETRWLSGWGSVVGMSATAEVRAAAELGLRLVVLAFVANVAAAFGGHDEVVAAGAAFAQAADRGLAALLSVI